MKMLLLLRPTSTASCTKPAPFVHHIRQLYSAVAHLLIRPDLRLPSQMRPLSNEVMAIGAGLEIVAEGLRTMDAA